MLRRVLALALVAFVLAALYLFWLRDVGLVAVNDVNVGGGGDRSDLVSQVEAVALEQSTLHVDQAALLEPIAEDPAVRGLTATPDFPHGLEVELDLRAPAAYLAEDGLVVAGDGVVLERADERPAGLPEASVEGNDGASAAVGKSIGGDAAALASILGAAPAPLVPEISEARIDPSFGILVIAGDGIELRFGGADRAEAKWQAATTVLADPQLGEIGYIDLSLPERPVAGAGSLSALESAPSDDSAVEATGVPAEGVVEPAPAGEAEATPIDGVVPTGEVDPAAPIEPTTPLP